MKRREGFAPWRLVGAARIGPLLIGPLLIGPVLMGCRSAVEDFYAPLALAPECSAQGGTGGGGAGAGGTTREGGTGGEDTCATP